MTSDQYVQSIINKYRVQTGDGSAAHNVGPILLPVIQQWAGSDLLNVIYSGSYAKGTAIRGITDVDLFISLSPNNNMSLKDIYFNLFEYLKGKNLSPRLQNVSIGLTYKDLSVDLIPGKKQSGNTTDHSIYRRKADTWKQTNVQQHIDLILGSGRVLEICALKIWRALHGLEFPSFYLELTAIEALKGKPQGQLSSNFLATLAYLRDSFTDKTFIDPINKGNRVSDDLTTTEKKAIADQANLSRAEPSWEKTIW